jgi:GDP-L-fucose synthase
MLFLQSKFYSECYDVNYNTFTPSNIYGPENSFDLNDSHFISSMIRKFVEANDGDVINFWGTGEPLRQHLFVDDLARIIVSLLDNHLSDVPVIVSPDNNLSIKQHVEICKKISNKDVKIKFDGKLDGQFRKDASNKKLKELIGDYNFTSLEEGLQKTYDWYYNKVKETL